MKNTICYSFSAEKEENDYFITEQGFTIDTTQQNSLENRKNGSSLPKKEIIDEIEDLPNEIWRPIDENGRYFISSLGRVKSYKGAKARLLKPYTNNYGYQRVDICLMRRHSILVHRLVGYAFVSNDDQQNKDTIDHIDGDKRNNKASNLRWLSRADNVREYYRKKGEVIDDDKST